MKTINYQSKIDNNWKNINWKKAEIDFLQKFTEKPNEYTEAQNG